MASAIRSRALARSLPLVWPHLEQVFTKDDEHPGTGGQILQTPSTAQPQRPMCATIGSSRQGRSRCCPRVAIALHTLCRTGLVQPVWCTVSRNTILLSWYPHPARISSSRGFRVGATLADAGRVEWFPDLWCTSAGLESRGVASLSYRRDEGGHGTLLCRRQARLRPMRRWIA